MWAENNNFEAELKHTGIGTTELESYNHVDPRDEGKKLTLASTVS